MHHEAWGHNSAPWYFADHLIVLEILTCQTDSLSWSAVCFRNSAGGLNGGRSMLCVREFVTLDSCVLRPHEAPWYPWTSGLVTIWTPCNIWHLWPRQRRHYSLRLSVTRCYKYDSTDMIIWSPGKPQLRTAFGYAIQNEQFQQMSKTIQNLSVKTCKECHAPWTVSQPRELSVCLARRPLASRTMWHRAAAKRFAGFPGTAQMTKDDKSVCASESSRWHTKNI